MGILTGDLAAKPYLETNWEFDRAQLDRMMHGPKLRAYLEARRSLFACLYCTVDGFRCVNTLSKRKGCNGTSCSLPIALSFFS